MDSEGLMGLKPVVQVVSDAVPRFRVSLMRGESRMNLS
jgi:hypothetical protein